MTRKIIHGLTGLVVNIVIVMASLGLSLCAAEWFVRTWLPCPDYGGGIRPAFYSSLFTYDDILGWKGVPSLKTPYFSKDFRISVSHDAWGYRNISPPWQAGKRNILLLGDSYAWGWGVEDDETAAAVLNREHENLNIYSLGIAGYGTDQSLLALQKHLQQFAQQRYEGVLLLFYMNDFDDNTSAERYGYPKPHFTLDTTSGAITLQNVPVPQRDVPQNIPVSEQPSPDTWRQQSELFNLLIKATSNIFNRLQGNVAPPPSPFDTTQLQQIALTRALITTMHTFCQQQGLPFHTVFLVTMDTPAQQITMMQQLGALLDARHTPHSFLHSRHFPRTDLWLDAHYTPYGQRRLAEHIEGVIETLRD